jgi:hypothetical protein
MGNEKADRAIRAWFSAADRIHNFSFFSEWIVCYQLNQWAFVKLLNDDFLAVLV